MLEYVHTVCRPTREQIVNEAFKSYPDRIHDTSLVTVVAARQLTFEFHKGHHTELISKFQTLHDELSEYQSQFSEIINACNSAIAKCKPKYRVLVHDDEMWSLDEIYPLLSDCILARLIGLIAPDIKNSVSINSRFGHIFYSDGYVVRKISEENWASVTKFHIRVISHNGWMLLLYVLNRETSHKHIDVTCDDIAGVVRILGIICKKSIQV